MKRCQPWLGTYVEITAGGLPPAALARAVDAAFDAVRQVHGLMSFHDPASELSRLNARAATEAVAVHPWTYAVLQTALALHRLSEGLFDCAVAPELVRRGLLPGNPDGAAAGGTLSDLQLLGGGRVSFRRPLTLDLGGIAKGFAVDRATEALALAGVPAAVVNAGGDLRVLGNAPQPVVVRDPRAPQRYLPLGELADGALATSSACFAQALVDPRDGSACGQGHSYTVVAPRCEIADALTKVLAASHDPDLPCFAALDARGLIL